jgi:hypothetical protein
MIIKRIFASLVVAVALVGGCTLAMPVASADTLPNGLAVTCVPDNPGHTTCIISGCARVHGDYVIDAVHVMWEGSQQEFEFKCINGATAKWGIKIANQFTIAIQGCRKKDFEGDWCGPWSDYTYKPPVAAPQPAPAAPAPAPAPEAPKQPVKCAEGSPVTEVPFGQTCPAPPAALTATVNPATDLYDKPNDNGDAQVIGQLRTGQVVKVAEACTKDAWCILTDPKGAAWGRDLTNN